MSLIINTLLFADDVNKGTSQVDLIDRVGQLGAQGVEIRREYFQNFDDEITKTADKIQKNDLLANYSVPDIIFEEDGTVNPKLQGYFDEGKRLGVQKIKFNVGYFDNFKGDLKASLSAYPIDEIEMNVENDQTSLSGTKVSLLKFLKTVYEVGLTQIGYVYDLGNWAFTHEDAVENAKELAPYTHYIHLKNIIEDEGNFATSVDLDTGIYDWKDIVTYLPDVDIALEYPIDTDEEIKEQMELI